MSDAEWTGDWLPIVTSGDVYSRIASWPFLIQLFRNAFKRLRYIGGSQRLAGGASTCANVPQPHFEYLTGDIDSVTTDGTHLTVTDGSTPAVVLIDGLSVKRYVAWAGGAFNGGTPPPDAASTYDLILDVDNPKYWLVVQGLITDTPTATTFEVLDDGRFTLNRTLASYAGKRWGIIKHEGRSWASRWPERPIDFIDRIGTAIDSTTTTFTIEGKAYATDALSGADLIAWVDGRVTRIPIDGNTAGTLEFSAQAEAPDIALGWYIVPGDSYFQLVKTASGYRLPSWQPFRWYDGLKFGLWSHAPDDLLRGYDAIAKNSEPILRGEVEGFCSTSPATTVLHTDAYIGLEDVCGAADTLVNPDLFFNLNELQYLLDAMGPYFAVEATLTDANHRDSITPGTMAMMMRSTVVGTGANVGHYEQRTITAVTAGVATLDSPLTLPVGQTERTEAHVPVHWTRFSATMQYVNSGTGTVPAASPVGSKLSGGFDNNSLALGGDVGRTIGISFGRARARHARVMRLYESVHAEPSMLLDPDTGDPLGYQDPPIEEAPTNYILTPKSTTAADYSMIGAAGDAPAEPLVDERIYRYHGCAGPDPTTGDLVGGDELPDPSELTGTPIGGGGTATPGYSCAKDFTCSPGGGLYLQRTRSGIITSTTANSITDDAAHLWLGDTPKITHSFTASGGSTTTIAASSMAANGFWNYGGAFGGYFVGMFARARIATGPDVWEKRLITGHSMSGTPTLTVTDPFSVAIASGMTVEIDEPGGLNGDGTGPSRMSYWRGATLQITSSADSSTHDSLVTHHDNITFERLAGAYTPQVGDTWALVYFRPGDAVQWKASDTKFIPPVTELEVDPVRIEPTILQDYGPGRKLDLPHPTLLTQLKNNIDAMHLATVESSFDNDGEDNAMNSGNVDNDTSDPPNWADIKSHVADGWNNPGATFPDSATVPGPDNSPPEIRAWLHIVEPVPFAAATAVNRYNYLTCSPFQCSRFGLLNRLIKIWAYAAFDAFDSPIGTITNTVGGTHWYFERALYTDGLAVGGGTGASLTWRKWTLIYSGTTSDPDIAIAIGDTDLELPSWPSNPSVVTFEHITDGDVRQTERGAYLLDWFATIDLNPIFEGDADVWP